MRAVATLWCVWLETGLASRINPGARGATVGSHEEYSGIAVGSHEEYSGPTVGSDQEYSGATVGSRRTLTSITYRSRRDSAGLTTESVRTDPLVVYWSWWDRFGSLRQCFVGRAGIVLDQYSNDSRVVMWSLRIYTVLLRGSCWDRFGSILDSCGHTESKRAVSRLSLWLSASTRPMCFMLIIARLRPEPLSHQTAFFYTTYSYYQSDCGHHNSVPAVGLDYL